MPIIAPSQSSTHPQAVDDATNSPDTSAAITGGIIVAILALSMAYGVGLYFLYRYSQHHPKPLNKIASVKLQTYFPCKFIFSHVFICLFLSCENGGLIILSVVVYVFLIAINIVEVSLRCASSPWVGYRYHKLTN